MNKVINVIKEEDKIVINLNGDSISEFPISQNKINGKVIFDKMDIQKDDVFKLKPLDVAKDSKNIEDIVLVNTHEFLAKVVKRINSKIIEINLFD